MVISMSGSGTFVVDEDGDTHDVTFTAKDSTNFSVDSANSQLVITSGSLSVTVKDLTTRKTAHQTVKAGKGESMSLPDTSTGDWSLALNLTPTKTKYAGTATVTTSTGKTVSLTATGSYNSKKDTSTIILKGANNSLSLVISTSGSTMHIQSATGKLLGQNINIKAK